ncbi:DUF1214 domain-containing protein [Flammeovirga sp. SubArs3]|uniref:DUF1214 domain-containing protein n=1 Tax=Flammeovirga sp. SubArs3 TaxID=2995316 RepID=UPI00248B7B1B|nr:DUF1214 domain-containing protein [Flammeovirga sp. SubArs3]
MKQNPIVKVYAKMKKYAVIMFTLLFISIVFGNAVKAQNNIPSYRIQEYIKWYPAIKQIEMRNQWLEKNKYGEWQISGLVTSDDRTVITPQADVNYGYSWFNITDKPVVITMPEYDKYFAMSIFDMNHFSQVVLAPEKPVVVRLPHQKSPIEDANEIVLNTNQGLIFTRQVVVNNESEVVELAKKITISGGGGDAPFIVPDFSEEEVAAGNAIIQEYALTKVVNARKLFGTTYEGIGDLDRAAGVFLGQLGTQSYIVDYQQYLKDQYGESLNGQDNYEITIPTAALMKNDKGYWSVTVYSMEDRYLIPNKNNTYVVNSYTAKPNADGTVTVRINPKGEGVNAIPNAGKKFYAVFRVYEPIIGLEFPSINKVTQESK